LLKWSDQTWWLLQVVGRLEAVANKTQERKKEVEATTGGPRPLTICMEPTETAPLPAKVILGVVAVDNPSKLLQGDSKITIIIAQGTQIRPLRRCWKGCWKKVAVR